MAAVTQTAFRYEPIETESPFAQDVIAGLTAWPKRLPPKYFYDEAGARLFEEITELPEYYPTRCELGILREHAPEIARFFPSGSALVEFGSGSNRKVLTLLAAAPTIAAYVPVDISSHMLLQEAHGAALRSSGPRGAAGGSRFHPAICLAGRDRCLGSHWILSWLDHRQFRAPCGVGVPAPRRAHVGAGREPDYRRRSHEGAEPAASPPTTMPPASLPGSTSICSRGSTESSTATSTSQEFGHKACYNSARHRIEMHLVSETRHEVHVAGRVIEFRAGESIHTENSYKYTLESFGALARGSAWTAVSTWTDVGRNFSVHALVRAVDLSANRGLAPGIRG